MYKNYTKIFRTPKGYINKLILIMNSALCRINETNKRKWIMRINITTFLLIITLTQVSAASFGQRITLKQRGITLEEVILEIRNQTGYDVLIGTNKFHTGQKMDANFQQTQLSDVMDKIVKVSGLFYTIEGKTIVIREKDPPSFLDRIIDRFANIDVRGRISDEQGNPLSGSTVSIKGTNRISKTNNTGQFTWNDVPSNAVLIISFVGYNTLEVALLDFNNANTTVVKNMKGVEGNLSKSGDLVLSISLKPNVALLDEAMIISTGYQNIRKGDVAGAYTKVNIDQIKVPGEASIDQMLQGVVAGVDVQVNSGQIGSTPKVRIRGTSTLLGNQEPLWVVDGVIQFDPQPAFTLNSNAGGADYSNAAGLRSIASNAISWLNPEDIKSLTVLKDASAAAIYGSRAANGVIVITTKKGKAGPLAVSFNSSLTIGQAPSYSLYNQMNSQERMQFSKELYDARVSYSTDILPIGYEGIIQQLHDKKITQQEFDKQYRKMEYTNTNWFGELFHNPLSQNYNLSLSGGSDKVSTRASLGVMNQIGEAIGNNQLSYTASTNTTFRFNKKLMANFILNAGSRVVDGYGANIDPFSYAYNTSRVIPLYDETGNYYYHDKWTTGAQSTVIYSKSSYLYNIKNEIANTGNQNNVKNLGANIDLSWNILPSLQYRALVSYTSVNSNIKSYATERAFYSAVLRGYDYGSVTPNSIQELSSRMPFGGMLYTENSLSQSYTVRNSLVFDKEIAADHRVTLQGGLEINSKMASGGYYTTYGYLYDRGETFANLPLTYLNLGVNTNVTNNDLYANALLGTKILNRKNNYLSSYSSAIYSYKRRYTLNFNGRVDASNRFGQDENNRFLPAWSVAGKWLAANEPFAKNWSWLNTFNIYASYGVQGNSVEEVSPYLIAQNSRFSANYNQYIMSVKSIPYPDLGWEKTTSYNFGAEFSLLEGRVGAVIDAYKKTSNVLSVRDVPFENGVGTATVEGNKVENKGYEFTLNIIPIRSRDWNWQLSVNSSIYKNKLISNGKSNSYSDYLNGDVLAEGQPYSTFYSYEFKGLDPLRGNPVFNNFGVNTPNPTDYLVASGKKTPDFAGGMNTSIRYKNFTAYAQFAMSLGSSKRLPALYNTNSNSGLPTPEQNLNRDLINRWKRPGDETSTNIPSLPGTGDSFVYIPTLNPTSSNPYTLYNLSDIRTADASFIRCRQLSLNYDFSSVLIHKLGVKKLALNLSTTNPFFFDFDEKWNGIDPETGGWPARKTTSLSVNLNF